MAILDDVVLLTWYIGYSYINFVTENFVPVLINFSVSGASLSPHVDFAI